MRLVLCVFALLSACGGGEGKDDCPSEEMVTVYPDSDGDGFGNSSLSENRCKVPNGFIEVGGDCADEDAETYPGARELCDNLDNNCNLAIDETLSLDTYYEDADGDGHGNPDSTAYSCAPPSGFTDTTDDCDDTEATAYLGAPEICDGIDNDCDGNRDDDDDDLDPASATTYYRDVDGDTYGNPNIVQLACAQLGANWVQNPDDCLDSDDEVHPLAIEVCNGHDDNCDGLSDDADPGLDLATRQTVYADADGDGFGDPLVTSEACQLPSGYVANDEDCDDTDPLIEDPSNWFLDSDLDGYGDGIPVESCFAPDVDYVPAAFPPFDCNDLAPLIYPGANEVCDGVDNDCDFQVDDNDNGLDIGTATEFFADLDGDGYGNALSSVHRCVQPAGTTLDSSDCDDDEFAVNPLAAEICDGLDNDCNGDTDDDDAGIDPAGFNWWYLDGDGDGFGDPLNATNSCDPPSMYVANRDDCNDLEPLLGSPADWYPDADLDGYGDASGPPLGLGPSCTRPVPGSVPDTTGTDCDDADPLVNPGAVEICDDGIDNNCEGFDEVCQLPVSCQAHLDLDPLAPSGVYTIEPLVSYVFDVWCDMDTDGGGWTLVASTRTTTLNDEASLYYNDVTTETPTAGHTGVWAGMRAVIDDNSDIRFACKANVFDANMTVDLSFYDIHWYREITTGNDGASCFNESNGAGYDQPAPARQNNLTMAFLNEGNDWNASYLEGEDSCFDSSDFTVDFDDRGKDSNQSDGTDWGEDDGTRKCGFNNFGQAWFIYIRELPT